MIDILILILLAAAAFAAGYVNTVAGAGSLLILPALIFSGLPANAANATNRVAILFQNIAAFGALRKGGVKLGKTTAIMTAIATIGSVGGAWVATRLTADQTQAAIAVAMVVMLALSLVPSRKTAQDDASSGEPSVSWGLCAGFLLIGFYGGLLQAGVGIVILLFLSLGFGTRLVVGNAIKLVVVLGFTLAALAIFISASRGALIDPTRATIIAVASSLGAWVGAKSTLKRGEKFIRTVVVVTVIASVIKLGIDLALKK